MRRIVIGVVGAAGAAALTLSTMSTTTTAGATASPAKRAAAKADARVVPALRVTSVVRGLNLPWDVKALAERSAADHRA